jgi:hypothetical protein
MPVSLAPSAAACASSPKGTFDLIVPLFNTGKIVELLR